MRCMQYDLQLAARILAGKRLLQLAANDVSERRHLTYPSQDPPVGMRVTMYACMYVCMYVCMYICWYLCMHADTISRRAPVGINVYNACVCMYMMYMCIITYLSVVCIDTYTMRLCICYMHTYTHTHAHTHTHTHVYIFLLTRRSFFFNDTCSLRLLLCMPRKTLQHRTRTCTHVWAQHHARTWN